MQKKFVFVTGGARSGKSTFAEKLAAESGKKVVYLATATIEDEEMAWRVERHRKRRPSAWEIIEEPYEVARAVSRINSPDKLILIDCLTLFLNNLLIKRNVDKDYFSLDEREEEEIINIIKDLGKVICVSPSDIVLVTNEVGWGLVPPYPAGRAYRDLLGIANQRLASLADEVYLVVSGLPVEIKSLALANNYFQNKRTRKAKGMGGQEKGGKR